MSRLSPVSPLVSSYTKQLDALNDLPSPRELFSDTDALLKTYRSLQREYSNGWKKYEIYQTQIRAFLPRGSALPRNKSITVSITEIEAFINEMKALHASFNKCLSQISNNIKPYVPFPPVVSKHTLIPRKRKSCCKPYKKKKLLQPLMQSQVRTIHNEGDCALSSDEKDESTQPLPMLIRPTSLRTFGALFSTEFQHDIMNRYEQSIGFDAVIPQLRTTAKQNKMVQFFHDNYYGQNEVFESPFGHRPVIYCDWTASGKVMQCVETYLEKEMFTLYANTHTTTSITGKQTSRFRSEARSIILKSLGGDPDEDVVIFTGNGVTAAIYKLSNILMKSVSKSYKPETTVVFISIYEHNSNIYIWQELGMKLIVIPEHEEGGLDLDYLETKLKQYTAAHLKHKYNLLIGSFTAASNVSGIIAPVHETTALLHQYGALSFWDYATAGPYLDVDMTNQDNPMLSKDAVFISTHKYLAGPGAPGILCAKKHLFQNYVPVIAGGGTVFAAYGIEDGQCEYLSNIEEREEGGTPNIIGSVRAAFAFMIKDHLTTEFIEQREKAYFEYFISQTKSLDNLVMIGDTTCHRLPVLSFLITYQSKYLHYNFIAALFNDLFGIQGRGGCACAGMYGVCALGLDDNQIHHMMQQMREEKNELARPGYFRINLHYTLNEKELKYIVNAVKYVCLHGWKFLPLYDVDKETGNYFHRNSKGKNTLRTLLDVSFDERDGTMKWKHKHMRVDGKALNQNLDKFFAVANGILNDLHQYLPAAEEFSGEDEINDDAAWYWLPSQLYQDVLRSLRSNRNQTYV